jgi:site-specific recombinase XerD
MAASHSVVLYEPTETSPEVTTAAGFLAGYSGRTREAYTLDLRQFIRWCGEHRLGLFKVTRTHIELYARQLEEEGKAPATIGRRLSTLAGFYRYASEEGVIEHSPAVHVRRPKLDYESHAVGLDHNELGAFVVQAGLSSPQDHALCSLLALNGLRISEALGCRHRPTRPRAGPPHPGGASQGRQDRHHPPRTTHCQALDLAIGERLEGPIFLGHNGQRLTRNAAARMVRRLAKRAGTGSLEMYQLGG